jgi:hypothetical protein
MLRRFVTALLLVSFSIASISAQQTKRNPEDQPRKVKQEPKKAYVNWINDVDLILTKSERDAWKKLENMESGAAVGPFVIGTTKVIPNLSGVFKRNQPVGVYLQVYNAAIDQTTLRPA